MKNVIVTGGAGYIGTHTCIELLNNGYQPIIFDNFCNSSKRNIDTLNEHFGNVPYYDVDCRYEWKVDNALNRAINKFGKISGVLHFAAYKSVGKSVKNPLDYYDNNVGSMQTMLRCMKKFGIENLVFSSSCTVYGQPDKLPVSEDTPLKPAEAPYGRSKQICEDMINDCVKAHQLRAVTLRYFNPIGAHPSGLIGELPLGDPENAVPYITQVASGLRQEFVVFGNDYDTRDGTCIRGYVHVVDIAEAHVKAMNLLLNKNLVSNVFESIREEGSEVDDAWLTSLKQTENESSNQVFNLGTGDGFSVLEIINAFEKESGVKLNYRIGPRRSGDVSAIYANVTKAKRWLGWTAKLNVNDAVRDAWRWQQTLNSEK